MSDNDIDAFNRAMAANAPAGTTPAPILVAVRGGAVTDQAGTAILWSDDGDWSEGDLERRPWAVQNYALRGAVTIVAGPGSAGKSTLTVTWGIAAALGMPVGSFDPQKPLKVLIYNVEDDANEQRRRLSAGLRRFDRLPRDIKGRLIRCGPQSVGTLIERDAATGRIALTGAWEGLRALIELHRPDIVILDPMVELHTAEENDNTALRLVVAHIRGLAKETKCAVILVHHTRKGATAGDVDAIRGAGSLVGAARAAFTVTPMSEEEAAALGISQALRKQFFRVDSVKGNYAPAREAEWYELQEHELDNGEVVAAINPWTPPNGSAGPSPEVLALLSAELERGTAGGPYSPRLALDQPRSVAALLAQRGIESRKLQQDTIKALLAQGWSVQRFRDHDGDPRNGLRSPRGLPTAKWLDGGTA